MSEGMRVAAMREMPKGRVGFFLPGKHGRAGSFADNDRKCRWSPRCYAVHGPRHQLPRIKISCADDGSIDLVN
jgi:hypothetical protein